MKCKRCGSEFEGNFCNKCGAPAESQNPYESYQNNQAPPYGYRNNIPQYGSRAGYDIQNRAPKKTNKFIVGLIIGLAAFFVIASIAAPLTLGILSTNGCAGSDIGVYDTDKSVTVNDFTFSISKIEYRSEYDGKQASSGSRFLVLNFTAKNTAKSEKNFSIDLKCFADDYQLECLSNNENFWWSEVSAGKTVLYTLVYEIPDNAEDIELECSIGDFFAKKFTYEIR